MDFKLVSDYKPTGDQPKAIDSLVRGIEMEITTAAACLAGGSDAVIMRHPAAIKAISEMIEALV